LIFKGCYLLATAEKGQKSGVERDDFDFLIFFAKKKSKNQNHLSPKVFLSPFGGK
jgi:hypothetical protein